MLLNINNIHFKKQLVVEQLIDAPIFLIVTLFLLPMTLLWLTSSNRLL